MNRRLLYALLFLVAAGALLASTRCAHAEPPVAVPAPVVVAPPAVPGAVVPAPVGAVRLTREDLERAAAVIAGVRAGLEVAQAGLQAPLLKPWTETRAGQIVMYCVAGAIIVTSAAGAGIGVALVVR